MQTIDHIESWDFIIPEIITIIPRWFTKIFSREDAESTDIISVIFTSFRTLKSIQFLFSPPISHKSQVSDFALYVRSTAFEKFFDVSMPLARIVIGE